MQKQNGWPECSNCNQWDAENCKCKAVNEEGICPCEVMSRKLFEFLVKQEDEE